MKAFCAQQRPSTCPPPPFRLRSLKWRSFFKSSSLSVATPAVWCLPRRGRTWPFTRGTSCFTRAKLNCSRIRGSYKAAGTLNIGCLATIASYLMPLLLKELADNHPEIQLRWREDKHEALLDALHGGGFDLIIIYDYDIPTTLQITPLRPMPVQLVLPSGHPLVSSQTCSLKDLVAEPMVLLDQPRTRDYFLSLFGSRDLSPTIAYRTASFEMVRSLVANGFGYTLLNFVPPYHVEGHGRLISRPLADLGRPQNLVLARLYRFRAPRLVDEFLQSVSIAVQRLYISAT